MLQRNIHFGMEYKIPITNKPLRKEQNYYALDDESLSIKIDIKN